MAKVPTISNATIQSIADPSVRSVLRAISDHLAVRSGDVGDGDQAYLTMADLKTDKGKALQVATALAAPMQLGMTTPGQPLANLADQLRDSILKSPAWQALFTRLAAIDAPDSIPGSTAYLLLQEAKARGTAITTVTNTIKTVNDALAQTTTTLTAAIGKNASAISDESTARATSEAAISQRITNLASSTGSSISGIYSELSTKTNNDNALAQAINTIWARVGTTGALVQSGSNIAVNNVGSAVTQFDQLQATVSDPNTGLVTKLGALRSQYDITANVVDGMKGNWSLKVDLDGYVSGLTLNASKDTAGNTQSMFLIAADKFAVGAPGRPNTVPFAIDAQTGLVSIDGSIVASGTISGRQLSAYSVGRGALALKAVGGAQIDDLAVGTLQIAGNSVTTGTFAQGGSNYVSAYGTSDILVAPVDLGDSYNSGVIISGVVSLWSQQNATYGIRILVNGVTAGDQRGSLQGGYPVLVPCSGFAKVGGGVATVTMQVYNPYGTDAGAGKSININSSTLAILGGKR